jgi:hypothetical protein
MRNVQGFDIKAISSELKLPISSLYKHFKQVQIDRDSPGASASVKVSQILYDHAILRMRDQVSG